MPRALGILFGIHVHRLVVLKMVASCYFETLIRRVRHVGDIVECDMWVTSWSATCGCMHDAAIHSVRHVDVGRVHYFPKATEGLFATFNNVKLGLGIAWPVIP